MHLLSESNLWETVSEFVTPNGVISKASGETEIIFADVVIENRSWVMINNRKLENMYSIKKVSDQLYTFVSNNPALGIQKGTFSIDRNTIFSKFVVENTQMDGFEVIIRNKSNCEAYGALYNNGKLINTWKADMKIILK